MENFTPAINEPSTENSNTPQYIPNITLASVLSVIYIMCLAVGFTTNSPDVGGPVAWVILILGFCLVIGLIRVCLGIILKTKNNLVNVFIVFAMVGGVIVLLIISAIGALISGLAGHSFGGGE